MTADAARLITTVDEISPDWVGEVLGRAVSQVEVTTVGTGQIGAVYRVRAPELARPLLVKLPTADVASRALLAGAYRSEVRFYAQIADTVSIRVPKVHLAQMHDDDVAFTLVMEDLDPCAQGDQIAGCTLAQALDAAENLAGLHAPRWCDETLLEIDGLTRNGPDDAALLAEFFTPAVDMFIDGLGDLLSPQTVALLPDVAKVIEHWELARRERFSLVHGDYRLDNLMFPPDGRPGVYAVDWQTLTVALPARDLAFFTGTSLPVEDRRAWDRQIVERYHAALLDQGVADHPLEECWEDYRFAMLQGPLVAVLGCAYGTRTERGDRMFAAMVNRAVAAIADLGTLDLLD
ncbi:phosphotransferase [Nocardioides sp. zg-ZUI104]|uniref:phosphotransferase family protein n=1 Tax=Nocardioides faecalis TaxID=2803858 RepID=UPI001BD04135|nr:phosphotransferase [Nocardioides faecalis]MBS4754249.1 phosphotransferase [Nocardioides faecalis]